MQTKLPFPKGKNSFLAPSSNVLASNGNLNLRYKVNGVAETFFTTEVMTTGVHYLLVFFKLKKSEITIKKTINLSNIMVGVADATVLKEKKCFLSQ
jgi:hypothetical protein